MSPSARDTRLLWFLMLPTGLAASLVVLILAFLLRESWPLLGKVGIGPFLLDRGWHPTERSFGLAPMIAGSLATSLGAILVAAPVGVASAAFCRFYAPPPVARLYRWIVILLAGTPSVVLGLWGLTALVPIIIRFEPPGTSLLAGIIVLALMIMPTVALSAEGALAAVPQAYWNGAAALGFSREAAIVHVLLPAARGGISAGVLLAAGRALGETMVVLMVSGNVVQVPSSLFDPVRTLTANIALEMAYAAGDHRAALFVSGILIAALVAVLAGSAARLGGGRADA